jgi:hypothetical protein
MSFWTRSRLAWVRVGEGATGAAGGGGVEVVTVVIVLVVEVDEVSGDSDEPGPHEVTMRARERQVIVFMNGWGMRRR